MVNKVTGKLKSNNTSGFCGVNKYRNKWRAFYQGKYIGIFNKKEDAIAEREKKQGFKYKEPIKKEKKNRDISALLKIERLREEKELNEIDDY